MDALKQLMCMVKAQNSTLNPSGIADLFGEYFAALLCTSLCICARLFICALWSRAGKEMTSWPSFVVSNCEFVTFSLVSWVRCDT